ncbi:MAG TPA: GtrA family protein [Afifellaceae bacterium]|nr:GtrA family protein [Afifellaceae bacterium]
MLRSPSDAGCLAHHAAASRFASRLPERVQRILRFGVVGILATTLYFVLVNVIVLGFGLEPVTASVCAYLISLTFSYAFQSRFTFRVAEDPLTQVIRFLVVSLTGLAISFFIMAFFVRTLALPYVVGGAVICLLIPLVNFLVFERWVFVRLVEGKAAGATGDEALGSATTNSQSVLGPPDRA